MSHQTLENAKVKLRAPEPADLELLYKWENNQEIWRVSNTLAPFSKFVLKRYIETAHKDIWTTKQLRLIVEAKDRSSLMSVPIGLVDLFDFDPFHNRAGIGILIANKEDRNKGYASETLQLVVNYAFATLQLHQLYSNIAVTNKVSLQLFKNIGFNKVGVKKEWLKTPSGWVDEVMLQLINPNSQIPKN